MIIIYCLLVNGNWGAWTEYTQCSVSCGGGTRQRRRVCVGTAHGGLACLLSDGSGLRGSEERENQICNSNECPSKLILYRIHRIYFHICTHLNQELHVFYGCVSWGIQYDKSLIIISVSDVMRSVTVGHTGHVLLHDFFLSTLWHAWISI